MAEELAVAPLEQLRRRRSAKWHTYPSDVLPLTTPRHLVSPVP